MKGFSLQANYELKHAFAAVSPDSEIAVSFTMARIKTMDLLHISNLCCLIVCKNLTSTCIHLAKV